MNSSSTGEIAAVRFNFRGLRNSFVRNNKAIQITLAILLSIGVGLAVIISTYYVDNFKLFVGLIGGVAFIYVTMRWPEFGILSLVALLSGLISISWLPLLHFGPISLHISDVMLIVLFGLVFLRATTIRGYVLYSSPIMLPLILFICAFMISAAYAFLFQGVGMNTVLRTIRTLVLWALFIPTLQLVRDEQALRRLLLGLFILAGILMIGIIFPNKLAPFFPVDVTGLNTGTMTYSGITRLYYQGDMILYTMIPVIVAALAMDKKRNQLWRICFLGLLLYWAFKTGYRQYWLTLPILIILLIVFLSVDERIRLLKRMVPVIFVVILGIILLMVFQLNQVDRIAYIITDRIGSLLNDPLKRENSLQWRLIESRYALIQFGQHPILGVGLANRFRPPMASESGLTMYDDWTSRFLENGYLWIAVMMGLVGLLPFLWFCIAYLFRVIRHYREITDDSFRAVYLGFGLGFLGLATCNFATPFFVIGGRLLFFPLAMAICDIILRLENTKRFNQPS